MKTLLSGWWQNNPVSFSRRVLYLPGVKAVLLVAADPCYLIILPVKQQVIEQGIVDGAILLMVKNIQPFNRLLTDRKGNKSVPGKPLFHPTPQADKKVFVFLKGRDS
jgi:hypothetical protein